MANVREELRKLSFAKGPRDMEKINTLRASAEKLSRQIVASDKYLLRLESTKPIQNVLAAARKKADADAKARLNRLRAEMRAKAEEDQKAMRAKYMESRRDVK